MAHQTAIDIIRVISEAVNPTGQFAYLRTWDASLEFNEVDQKIFLYPISGQVDITNGYFETWTCSMGFFFQDAPDSTNEQREQLITNADVLLKAFILAADTVDGVQFSIVRKRPVYRDMAGTYSGYLVDFTLSLTEDICNGDTPSVIIPVGKTFCELVDECLGISVSGDEDLVLNQKGEWVQGGGGAVDSVNGKTGVVVLDADDIAETATRFWLTNILKSAYDSAVTWISTNGTNLLNHLTNTSNPHSTTAAQVGAPSGSGTSTGTNTGDQDLSGLVPYTGATSDVNLGNNYITAKNAKIAGTGGNGFIELLPQNAGVATPASGVRLWVDNAGRLGWRSASGYAISFDDTGLNGSRNYVLPNASGTLALTSDLDLKQDKPISLKLSGDVTTSSNASSSITGLVATLEANTNYIITGVLRSRCSGAGGVRYAMTLVSLSTSAISVSGRSSGASLEQHYFTENGNLSNPSLVRIAGGAGDVCLNGNINVGATAGTIQLNFASATGGQTSTIDQFGTWIEIKKA